MSFERAIACEENRSGLCSGRRNVPGLPELLPGWAVPSAEFFSELEDRFEYEYDVGHSWLSFTVLMQAEPIAYLCLQRLNLASFAGGISQIATDPSTDSFSDQLPTYNPDHLDPMLHDFVDACVTSAWPASAH